MNKVNLHAFYELGYLLHPLTKWEDTNTKGNIFVESILLVTTLKDLLNGVPIALRNDKPVATLIETITNAIKRKSSEEPSHKWFESKVESFAVEQIATRARNLEIILSNEFPLLHSYLISEKGLLSIDTLITCPERVFSMEIIEKLDNMEGSPLDDFKESGRCLAFGFATASGFHIVRSAEAVLRNWHQLINSTADFKTEWAPCIDRIRAENKSEKNQELKRQVSSILDVLSQIKDTHRNPLMHPEISLGGSEAEILFNLTTSAIHAMMQQISRLPQEQNQ